MADGLTEAELARRLAAAERKLEHLYRNLGLDPPPEPDPESHASRAVYELAQAGKTIQAIKLYRDETGCDLATAKRRVEEIADGGLIL